MDMEEYPALFSTMWIVRALKAGTIPNTRVDCGGWRKNPNNPMRDKHFSNFE
jgi:hypothetical protein